MSTLTDLWQRVTEVQAQPPAWLVLVTCLVALAGVMSRQVWPLARNVVTIAHEGGHAIVALAAGRRLAGIRLHSDTSGVTVSAGKPTGLGVILTTAAGYVTPSLLGLLGAALLAAGRISALLWSGFLLLAGMLAVIRNLYGAISVFLAGSVVFVVSWFTPANVQAAFAYLLIWFLLLAGIRPVVELQRKRLRGQAPYSDADQLARLTSVPGIAWVALFGVVTVLALLTGGRWLLV